VSERMYELLLLYDSGGLDLESESLELIALQQQEIERLQQLVRDLRQGWFMSQLYSRAHEREWESEEDENLRNERNERLHMKYTNRTERILRGEKECLLPRCEADMDKEDADV
jgi:hypothetical protein